MKVFVLLFILTVSIFPEKEFIRIINENDAYLLKNSDQYYTGGFRLEYHSSKISKFTNLIFYFQNHFFKKYFEKQYTGYNLGQELYTPTNILKSGITLGDRPYASRNYISNSMQYIKYDSYLVHEIEIGKLGNSSGGGLIQEASHKLIQSPTPNGWENQIPEYTTINYNLAYRKFFTDYFGFSNELQMGNLYNQFSLSPIFRMGNQGKNPLTGFTAKKSGGILVLNDSSNSIYSFYLQPGVQFTFYDGTLQGNPFNKKKYYDKEGEDLLYESSKYLSLQTSSQDNQFIQNKVIQSLLDDNGSNTSARYLLFESYFVKNTKNPYGIGMNYILFNNVFNSTESISQEFKFFLLNSLYNDSSKLTEEARIVAIYTLFKEDSKKLPSEIKLLSYKILADNLFDSNEKSTFLFLLNEYFLTNYNKTYTSNPQRVFGFLNSGYNFIKTNEYFLSLGYSLQSIDFQTSRGVPKKHEWAGIQVGIYF
jgi:hypothetical protein